MPMETNFTFSMIRTLVLTFVVAFSTLNLAGQTTHNVAVTNNVFTPSELTITAGDKVIWKNTQGSHNVNGTKATFASNPESFGNSLGTDWTYEYIFNTAGTYNYQCDPHAAMGMIGKVIVNPKTVTDVSTLTDKTNEKIRLYPNPASNYIDLMVTPNYASISSLKVFSITGTLVDENAFSGNAESIRYDISCFKNGLYFMEINAGTKKDVLKFLKQ
jgi:plastocyanin